MSKKFRRTARSGLLFFYPQKASRVCLINNTTKNYEPDNNNENYEPDNNNENYEPDNNNENYEPDNNNFTNYETLCTYGRPAVKQFPMGSV